MKKMKMKLIPVIGLLAALTIITSCGKDDEPVVDAPSVSVSATVDGDVLANGGDVIVGSAVALEITINAPGGVNGLDVNGTSYSRGDLGADAGDLTASLTLNITPSTETDIDGTASFEIEAVDDLGQTSATVTFAYTIVAAPSPDARSYSAILLAAPIGSTTAEKTSETFFSTNTGLTYSMNEVLTSSSSISPDIDFGYFYGSGSGGTEATLSDPASYPFAYGQASWNTRNSTTFKRTSLTSSSFTEVVTYADIDAAYEEADDADSDAGIESGLVEGEVLAFATDSDKEGGSKKGLILVTSITAGDGVDGKIELDILVQEEAEN
jgi:hypothetical protein